MRNLKIIISDTESKDVTLTRTDTESKIFSLVLICESLLALSIEYKQLHEYFLEKYKEKKAVVETIMINESGKLLRLNQNLLFSDSLSNLATLLNKYDFVTEIKDEIILSKSRSELSLGAWFNLYCIEEYEYPLENGLKGKIKRDEMQKIIQSLIEDYEVTYNLKFFRNKYINHKDLLLSADPFMSYIQKIENDVYVNMQKMIKNVLDFCKKYFICQDTSNNPIHTFFIKEIREFKEYMREKLDKEIEENIKLFCK